MWSCGLGTGRGPDTRGANRPGCDSCQGSTVDCVADRRGARGGARASSIVHRDLKPSKTKVRPDASVKVLDFGLAKAFEPITSGEQSQSPTLTSPAQTLQGVILGTAASTVMWQGSTGNR